MVKSAPPWTELLFVVAEVPLRAQGTVVNGARVTTSTDLARHHRRIIHLLQALGDRGLIRRQGIGLTLANDAVLQASVDLQTPWWLGSQRGELLTRKQTASSGRAGDVHVVIAATNANVGTEPNSK